MGLLFEDPYKESHLIILRPYQVPLVFGNSRLCGKGQGRDVQCKVSKYVVKYMQAKQISNVPLRSV